MKIKKIFISKDGKYYSAEALGGKNNPVAVSETPTSIECHANKGIVGDRFYNFKEDFKGQITFISYELHLKLQKHLNREFPLELYRRNIFVTGADPLEYVGKKFKIGRIEFEGIENCRPCKFMEEFIGNGALAWMKLNNSGGLRAKILSSGTLNLGDSLIE